MTETGRASVSRRAAGQLAQHPVVPFPVECVSYLVATAARAPSLHNTQPWRFLLYDDAIELYADTGRRLRLDPAGREMFISCGAALFGLRLAIRSLGRLPIVDLLPDQAPPRALARVRLGEQAPMTSQEHRMLTAIPHRHTHRGPFSPEPLPAGLIPGLQHEARAEGAALAMINQPGSYQQLAALAEAVRRDQALNPISRAETRRWIRTADSRTHDGVPAQAFTAAADIPAAAEPGTLPQRDFDLGRHVGLLQAGGPPAGTTAVLTTTGDGPADWLRAGQALYRVLLRAASVWVFASLHTQPLEIPPVRTRIRSLLHLPGDPQMLLQLGVAHTTQPTARRPARELLIRPDVCARITT